MCGACPEIGKRISLAMQWQFNEGIVCKLEIVKRWGGVFGFGDGACI